MSIASLGKNFESIFKAQMSKVENVYVMRLYDQVSFKYGSKNPCDFIVYRYASMYFIELKTCQGASLPRKNITDFQMTEMYKAVKTKGIKAYVICWFYDKDVCRAFPIEYLHRIFFKEKKKSVRYDDEKGILISGTKLRSYFVWHWEDLFDANKQRSTKKSGSRK